MEIISHRGANREFPENSMAAFERAVEIGVDALETDVLLTKDGSLIARHDDLIEHHGRWRSVTELTYEDISTIDLGKGNRVPLIGDVLENFSEKLPILLDIKTEGVSRQLSGLIRKLKKPGAIHVTTFIQKELLAFKDEIKNLSCSAIFTALPFNFNAALKELGVREVSLFRGYLNERITRSLVEDGVKVRVYTVNLPEEAERLRSWGVSGIFTDDPLVMQKFRKA